MAYRAATGRQLWVRRYNGSANDDDFANAIAVSPGGSMVFVTGAAVSGATGFDYATVAYRASTGAELWVRRYDGPANGDDEASDLVVSPDGATVFVTGASARRGSDHDYATVAYRAATGRQLWVRRYDGTAHSFDVGHSLATSSDGSTLFVTGASDGSHGVGDYATLAYRAATGRQLWVRRYNGTGDDDDYGYAVVVSPDGSTAFVTGYSAGPTSPDIATVAYRASTGRQLWVRRYDGPGHFFDFPRGMGLSPDGSTVYVTGQSFGSLSDADYATLAYRAANGASLWVKRYDGPGSCCDDPRGLVVSPDGSRVYVTGASPGAKSRYDFATVAYGASTGRRVWVKRYNGPANDFDAAEALAASPDGSALYVTGESKSPASYDFATVAYRLT